ncbi:unnamed protein product [Vicia faba]|uniref:DNA repair metallo-beta-lactamase domain-containing protein n=1 Tax=Vicia faba TaxID=3906 RepID=A0AAV0ZL07_VICFA|nr:unnamed protein product [Vicia faba]
MPIEMPQGLPFSVDTWTPSSKSSKRHHFLTHAHKDHSSNITSHSSFPIYSTLLTKTLLLQHYPLLHDSLFYLIEVGQSLIIHDPDGDFSVTAFDANHCPGAVMFLFEGQFGRKGKKPACSLDCVFLDSTFANFSRPMPTKRSSIQQVVNCIWKHPDASTVYLTCDVLGQEDILVQVSQTFGAKIYVDKAQNPECFKNLMVTAPEIICEDPSSRFHLFDGSPGLYERAQAKLVEAKATLQTVPLIVRPSAQWYACEELSDVQNTRKKRMNEAVKDQFGVWHVCYSMHSSKEELEEALQLLAPRWVVSTTPPCRAMELNYVKKYCFNSEVRLNNSVLKLLDMTVETSGDVDAYFKPVNCHPVLEGNPQPCAKTKSPIKQCTDVKAMEELTLNRSPVTLFGRARLGIQDVDCLRVRCNILPVNAPLQTDSSDAKQECLDDVAEVKWERSPERKEDLHNVNKNPQSEVQENTRVHESYKNIGSPGLSEHIKKYYRPMNIPTLLPSLVDLRNSMKRAKRRIDRFSAVNFDRKMPKD